MFYSVFVLGKKGPLARVWLAAHWDKKITKSQILETNIVESVDSILQPRIKLSLRTSSHLLLGIVRIYARKTIYLLQDCQDAAFKIKSAFRPGAVDLPEGKQEAAVNAITLPEMLDFVTNFDLIEPPVLIEPVVNTTNHRNITLAEDVAMTDDTFLSGYGQSWSGANQSEMSAVRNASNVSGAKALQQLDANLNDDGFGGELGCAPLPDDEFFQVDIDADGAPKGEDLPSQTQERPMSRASNADSEMSAAHSMADSGPPSTPGGAGYGNDDIDNIQGVFDSMREMEGVGDENAPPAPASTNGDSRFNNGSLPPIPEEGQEDQALPDSMVLDPVIQDAQGLMPRRKRRRRLGIIVDEVKTLSGEEIKAQLSDTKDIVTSLDLAPPSKQLMEVRRSANVDKLFAQPECQILSKVLMEHYTRNLISSKLDHEAADGELPSMARHDGYNHNSFNGNMDSFVAPSFGYEGDMSGPQDVSYLMDNQGDITGNDFAPPRTPRTPAGAGQQRSSPKKKRARLDNSNDQSVDPKQRSATKRAQDIQADYPATDMGYNDSYNNNNTVDEDDAPTEDPMNVGETEEQYEERIRNRRTHILLQLLGPQLDEGNLQFSHVCRNYHRKQVAQHFFSLLVLKKQQAISLVQEETGDSYGELYINKGPRYENFVPSN